MLALPSESYIAEQLDVVEPQRLHATREHFKRQLASGLKDDWIWAFESHATPGAYSPDAVSSGKRALANLALSMLCLDAAASGDPVWPGRAYQRFKDATNMTDRLGALSALINSHSDLADAALARFYEMFSGEALVIEKCFSMHVTAPERDGQVFARAR